MHRDAQDSTLAFGARVAMVGSKGNHAVASRRWRSLVAIQPGNGRLPFFCVHGAGGNVLNFRDLAHGMSRAQPFYGLQAWGVDGERPPLATIEEMASAYLAEVTQAQPQGPYLLGGYSGGGVVAFEMARRLSSAGERVALLALIDTYFPRAPLQPLTLRSRLERLAKEGRSYVVTSLRRRLADRKRAKDLRLLDEVLARGEKVPFALRDAHLVRSFRRAAALYEPLPWTGHATLFRAEDVPYAYRAAGSAYGWDRVILGGVDAVAVSGSHHTLLLGKNAGPLVRSLSEAVARAQR
jgi:thioesterase domain-containing protein